MKRLLACLCLLAPGALSADIADDIKKELAPFEVLRGDFEQSKSIRVLKKPLKSSGSFVLVKGLGVLWKAAKPLPSTLKVTRDAIIQIKDGKAAFTLKSSEQPSLKLVGDVLFAVFSADVAELKRHFEITGSVEQHHWKAQLSPKEAWVSKVAKSITLEGGQALESMQIAESSGDHTEIHFKNVSLKSSLKPQEKALFEQK